MASIPGTYAAAYIILNLWLVVLSAASCKDMPIDSFTYLRGSSPSLPILRLRGAELERIQGIHQSSSACSGDVMMPEFAAVDGSWGCVGLRLRGGLAGWEEDPEEDEIDERNGEMDHTPAKNGDWHDGMNDDMGDEVGSTELGVEREEGDMGGGMIDGEGGAGSIEDHVKELLAQEVDGHEKDSGRRAELQKRRALWFAAQDGDIEQVNS